MHRSTLLACATAASLIAGGGLAFGSAANPNVHDPAGDAQNSRHQNVPSVDILSADVTTDGTKLVFRESFAAAPTLSGPVTYAQAFYPVADNHATPGEAIGSSVNGGQATFATGYKPAPEDCDYCEPTAAVSVSGTTAVTGASIVTTYSLSAINQQLAANGLATIKAGTTYYDAYAFAKNDTPANALDRLQSQSNAKNATDYGSDEVYNPMTYEDAHSSFSLGA